MPMQRHGRDGASPEEEPDAGQPLHSRVEGGSPVGSDQAVVADVR